MTALAVRREESTALASQQQGVDFGALMEFARELVPTGFLPDHIKNPAQAVAIILAGRELGMEPMLSLRSISMVKGKIVVAADAQLALFKSKGGRAQFERLDDTIATLHLIHPNGDTHTETFSIEDAKRAGLLNNNNWKNFPKAMLRSRCITAGLKSIGFEPTSGTYDPDEAQHFTMPAREEGEQRRDPTAGSKTQGTGPTGSDEMTLEEALAMPLPGKPTAWNNNGGKALHLIGTSLLTGVRAWCEKQVREAGERGDERPDLSRLIEACTLVIDSREQAPATAAANTEPGEVADALEPTEKAKEREAAPARTKRESTPAQPDDCPF